MIVVSMFLCVVRKPLYIINKNNLKWFLLILINCKKKMKLKKYTSKILSGISRENAGTKWTPRNSGSPRLRNCNSFNRRSLSRSLKLQKSKDICKGSKRKTSFPSIRPSSAAYKIKKYQNYTIYLDNYIISKTNCFHLVRKSFLKYGVFKKRECMSDKRKNVFAVLIIYV